MSIFIVSKIKKLTARAKSVFGVIEKIEYVSQSDSNCMG